MRQGWGEYQSEGGPHLWPFLVQLCPLLPGKVPKPLTANHCAILGCPPL